MIKSILFYFSSVVFSIFLMSSSCEEKVAEAAAMEGGVKAVVTAEFANEGCAYLLKATIDGEEQLFYPVELADEFKKDKQEVWMKYHTSRIVQTDCTKGQPIIIEEIVAAK